jgi:hypothetical protein
MRVRSPMKPMKSKSTSSTGRPWRNPTLLSQKSPWTSWRGSRATSPASAWVTSSASPSLTDPPVTTPARARSVGVLTGLALLAVTAAVRS